MDGSSSGVVILIVVLGLVLILSVFLNSAL